MEKLKDSLTEKTNVDTAERVISGFGGAALVYLGIRNCFKNPSLATGIELLSGAYLLYRGITVFCHRNAMEKEYSPEPKSW